MITLDCKYNQIKVFTDELELSAENQLRAMCEQPFMTDSKIRVMPDVHAGKGCTIGTTMTIGDYVVPSMVGVDIGCGMLTIKLEEKRLNLPALDSFIRQNIPHGRDVRERAHRSHGRPHQLNKSLTQCSLKRKKMLEKNGKIIAKLQTFLKNKKVQITLEQQHKNVQEK